MGTTEEALVYLSRGYYLGFTGYLCKVWQLNMYKVKVSMSLEFIVKRETINLNVTG